MTEDTLVGALIDPREQAALNGVPNFYELPDEVREKIEKNVLKTERFFWLNDNVLDKDDTAIRTMLRRAIYAEQRCWEMENQLAEMAMITQGAAQRVSELEASLNELSGKV